MISVFSQLLGAWVLMSPAAVTVPETEPNDLIAQADVTGLVDVGVAVVVNAAITDVTGGDAFGDRDFYSFVVTPDAGLPLLLTVGMDVSESEFDGYLRLFSSEAHELLNHDDASASNTDPLLQTYIVEPGTYYIGVSHSLNSGYSPTMPSPGRLAGSSAYGLAVTLSPAAVPSGSIELPDDTAVNIGSVPIDITGQFIGDGPDGRRDVDCYFVNVAAPARLIAEVKPTELGLLDPFIGYDAENSPVTSRSKRLDKAILATGSTVTLCVRGGDPADGDAFTTTGHYDLHMEVIPVPGVSGPFEPNDSILQSSPTGPVGPGSVQLSASIGDGVFGALRGDVDFYTVSIGPDLRLDIEVAPTAGPSGLIPVLFLYDDLGQQLDRAIPDESGIVRISSRGDCRYFYWLPEQIEPTTVHVAVMGAGDRLTMDPLIPNPNTGGGHGPPPYESPLALTSIDGGPGSTGDYIITFQPVPDSPCGAEPNDTIQGATTILVDEGEFHCSDSIASKLCVDSALGVDFFRATVPNVPRVLTVRVDPHGCGYRRSVRLFNANGDELASAFTSPSDDGRPGGELEISMLITAAGQYYIGVADAENLNYHPFVSCSGTALDDTDYLDQYTLDLVLRDPASEVVPPTPVNNTPGSDPTGGRLFAAALDELADSIVELSPSSGATLRTFAGPEIPLGGAEGLAFDGSDLFVIGHSARYPYLYRLNPDTGEVLERMLTWFGSGRYGGLAVMGGTLYVVDLLDHAFYTIPTSFADTVRRVDFGQAGVALRGPIASAAGQQRLIATDAANASILHHIDPATGGLFASIDLSRPCACSADFDVDGDVDVADLSHFDACDAEFDGVSFGPCLTADLDCDGVLNSVDRQVVVCQGNGSGNPPNAGCCGGDLPDQPVCATGLATTGPDMILAGDWTAPILQRFTRFGQPRGTVDLDHPAGSLAGTGFAGADGDGDFDVDLLDFAVFQSCFGRPVSSAPPACAAFDFNRDDDVDSADYVAFQDSFTGVAP